MTRTFACGHLPPGSTRISCAGLLPAARTGYAAASGTSPAVIEELEDHLRRLVEDCDHLQVRPRFIPASSQLLGPQCSLVLPTQHHLEQR